MSTTWILLANSSKAQLYSTHKARLFRSNGHDNNSLSLVNEFTHEESRKKTSELMSDKFGSYRFGACFGAEGHGSFSEQTDPKEHEAEVFALELIAELEMGRTEGKYDDLIIVANPHFKGLLSRHLSGSLNKYISKTIEKDYTHYAKNELVKQLQKQI